MHHSSHHGAGALVFLAIFLLVVGGGFLLWGLSARRKGDAWEAAARSWPVAPGVVVSAYVGAGYVEGTAMVTGHLQDRGRHYHTPVVQYRYTVGAQEYEGNRLRFGWLTCRTNAEAQRILAAYPVGRQLAVRFDPANPAESVLEVAAANSNAMVGIICGAGAMAFGLVMLLISLKGH